MVITIVKLLLQAVFQGFFNFLKEWAQTQRVSPVIHLLEESPLRDLYKHGLVGTQSDVSCFDCFFATGENLRISNTNYVRTLLPKYHFWFR